jgi:hypothetical protein
MQHLLMTFKAKQLSARISAQAVPGACFLVYALFSKKILHLFTEAVRNHADSFFLPILFQER